MISRIAGILVLCFVWMQLTPVSCAIQPAFANTSSDTETPEETAAIKAHGAMLRAGEYESLERDFNQVQKQYEEGKRDDVSLQKYFDLFIDTDPTLEAKYT